MIQLADTVASPNRAVVLPSNSRVQPDEVSQPNESGPELMGLYEKIVESRPGTRDAEIFESIREWTFSDFSKTPSEFAKITKAELDSWQKRNRINLSAGQIRPDPMDMERAYAWGQIRMAASANRLHTDRPPPSAMEIKQSWQEHAAHAKSI